MLLLLSLLLAVRDEGSAATEVEAQSRLGILNATLSCGVDPSGVTDSTVALQACIEKAYTANPVSYTHLTLPTKA